MRDLPPTIAFLPMLRVALTGGIATGKSYVRARIAARGVPTIDADAVVHELFAAGTAITAGVERRFGAGVLRPDGAVDRRVLGRMAFADERTRRDLEELIHPAVFRRIALWAAAERDAGARWTVADIPLLFETGRQAEFDCVVATVCGPDLQLLRVMARGGMTEAEARARLAAQWPAEEKGRLADRVIRTDGTFAETDRQVDELCARLDAGSGPQPNQG